MIPSQLIIVLTAIPIIKYWLIFLLVIIEGPIITMGAGLLVALGYLQPVIVYAIIVAAELVSDSLYFGVGYWGRGKILKKYGHHFSADLPKLQKLEKIIRRRSGLVLIGGKLTHLAGVPVLIAAGLARIDFRKFLIYDTVATLPKSLTFLVVGYYFGKLSGVINQYLEYGTLITFGLISLAVFVYIFIARRIGKNILS